MTDNPRFERDRELTSRQMMEKLSQKFHPDRNPGDARAAKIMGEIGDAYALATGKVLQHGTKISANPAKLRQLYNEHILGIKPIQKSSESKPGVQKAGSTTTRAGSRSQPRHYEDLSHWHREHGTDVDEMIKNFIFEKYDLFEKSYHELRKEQKLSDDVLNKLEKLALKQLEFQLKTFGHYNRKLSERFIRWGIVRLNDVISLRRKYKQT